MIKFTNENRMLEDGEIIVIYEGDLLDGSPLLQAWSNEGPYATVSLYLDEHPADPGWINIDHDVITTNWLDGFLDAFLEHFTEESVDITFGPYCTRTLQVRLKDDWRSKVLTMEV